MDISISWYSQAARIPEPRNSRHRQLSLAPRDSDYFSSINALVDVSSYQHVGPQGACLIPGQHRDITKLLVCLKDSMYAGIQ